MFQSNNRERLAVAAIKQSKHSETGHWRAQNISRIGSLNTSEMPAPRVFPPLNDQIMNCPNKPAGDLGPPILNAKAIAVMA
jgi:hypothetical protein